MLNRDIKNTEIDIYDVESKVELDGEIDMRMFSEDGRNQIKKDILDTKNHTQEIYQAAEDVVTTEKTILEFGSQVQKYATDRELLIAKAADEKAQENLKGENGAEQSQQEIQNLSDELSKKDDLDEMANVNLYDGSQTLDDTVVTSTNDFNKEKSNAGYDEANNDIYLNIDKTDMTNSTEVVKATLHEQERHTQSQNGDTNTLSLKNQTKLSKARGERASTVWDDYSDLAGIETKSSTSQITWKNNNINTATIKVGTSKIATVDSEDVKPFSINGAIAYGKEYNNKILNSQQKVIGITGKYTLTV